MTLKFMICLIDLHSNMVLLKLKDKLENKQEEFIYIPIWYYLNIFDGIKAIWLDLHLHSNMVLLK